MSSIQHLRKFIRDRLTAAAEEIFIKVERTIVRYEEDLRQMENYWKPQIKLHTTEQIQSHISNENKALAIQQLCKERRSSQDQLDLEPYWTENNQMKSGYHPIEEEEEELGLRWIKEEEEPPVPDVIKEENEEPECKWAKEDPTEPDFLLKELNEQGPPWNRDEKTASQLLEVKEKEHSVMSVHEIGQLYILPLTKDQSSCQEEEQTVQEQSITLETFTFKEIEVNERKPRTVQPSYHRSPVVDKDQEGSSTTASQNQPQTDREKTYLKCEICGRYLKNKFNMKRHVRTHTNEKPFKCEICGRYLKNEVTMKRHYTTHTGERPFQCQTCGKSFSRMCTLTKHIRTHTGEKPYTCKICGRSFSQMSILTIHWRSHTGERPFSCRICGKRLSRPVHLKEHMKTHTGEKPFSCETCGKRFSRVKGLNGHIRTHTGGKSFAHGSNINSHTKTHTSEKPLHVEYVEEDLVTIGRNISHETKMTSRH